MLYNQVFIPKWLNLNPYVSTRARTHTHNLHVPIHTYKHTHTQAHTHTHTNTHLVFKSKLSCKGPITNIIKAKDILLLIHQYYVIFLLLTCTSWHVHLSILSNSLYISYPLQRTFAYTELMAICNALTHVKTRELNKFYLMLF